MDLRTHVALGGTLLVLGLTSAPALAQTTTLETVQVTATREPEPVDSVPASISVVTDAQMKARGVHDLRGALALVAGVEITTGGDGGPAGSVPAMWGLREFDAFLLVIDGVPAGGAFNPQLTTLSLENVERIEVMRGSAPVMFGATSFVGVIQVIHYAAGHAQPRASVSAGSHGSMRASVNGNIGQSQSISLEGERVGSTDQDNNFRRGRLLYRAQGELAGGSAGFDLDVGSTRQQPGSPTPRTGAVLDPSIPIGANFNPSDARLDEDRVQAIGRYTRKTALGDWQTTLSYTRTNGHFIRGFLAEDYADAVGANAFGFEQQRRMDDVYFDSHLELNPGEHVKVTTGIDWLYGRRATRIGCSTTPLRLTAVHVRRAARRTRSTSPRAPTGAASRACTHRPTGNCPNASMYWAACGSTTPLKGSRATILKAAHPRPGRTRSTRV